MESFISAHLMYHKGRHSGKAKHEANDELTPIDRNILILVCFFRILFFFVANIQQQWQIKAWEVHFVKGIL